MDASTIDVVPTGRERSAGRVAIGVPGDARLASFIGARGVVEGFDLDSMPWRVSGVVFGGPVIDEDSHAAALDAALRGADVIADVAADMMAEFVDDLARAGIDVWSVDDADDPSWAPLLEVLATGCSVAEAARHCHLSVRSAHRQLAAARADLDVATTAAAIAAWAARRSPH